MSGTTYSRTSGYAILPGAWDHMRARRDVPDADKLASGVRFAYDRAAPDERADLMQAALMPLLTPPSGQEGPA